MKELICLLFGKMISDDNRRKEVSIILHKYSKEKLKTFIDKVSEIQVLKDNKLCIYTTGSYGRLEASEYSDIDLFFIDTDDESSTSNIDRILIIAEMIGLCRKMNFPEFSNDGMYLSVHRLSDIIKDLGSPTDDYKNHFTSRLLLLLESKPIYNDDLYTNVMKTIINSYYSDFHNHSDNFKPIFLVNDIVRFWKTLCLNYEHNRRRKNLEGDNKNKAHSKNLKLGFSRKLTCFSFILSLISYRKVILIDDVLKIVKMTPTERLLSLKNDNKKLCELIDTALETYQWFIEHTQIPYEEMISWIGNKKNRDAAFLKSRNFGYQLFEIMQKIDNQNLLQKLII